MSTQDVKVEVRHCLACVRTVVRNDAIAPFHQTLLAGNLDNEREKFGNEAGVSCRYITEGREMGLGYDEDMGGGLGLEVPKGDATRRLGDERGSHLSIGNTTKNAFTIAFHGGHNAPRSTILPLTGRAGSRAR